MPTFEVLQRLIALPKSPQDVTQKHACQMGHRIILDPLEGACGLDKYLHTPMASSLLRWLPRSSLFHQIAPSKADLPTSSGRTLRSVVLHHICVTSLPCFCFSPLRTCHSAFIACSRSLGAVLAFFSISAAHKAAPTVFVKAKTSEARGIISRANAATPKLAQAISDRGLL